VEKAIVFTDLADFDNAVINSEKYTEKFTRDGLGRLCAKVLRRPFLILGFSSK